jgi:hypothetical protein
VTGTNGYTQQFVEVHANPSPNSGVRRFKNVMLGEIIEFIACLLNMNTIKDQQLHLNGIKAIIVYCLVS